MEIRNQGLGISYMHFRSSYLRLTLKDRVHGSFNDKMESIKGIIWLWDSCGPWCWHVIHPMVQQIPHQQSHPHHNHIQVFQESRDYLLSIEILTIFQLSIFIIIPPLLLSMCFHSVFPLHFDDQNNYKYVNTQLK